MKEGAKNKNKAYNKAGEFMDSEIYMNWRKYRDRYKDTLSKADVIYIREQIEVIIHEVESSPCHGDRFEPIHIIEKLYAIQKRIEKK